LRYPPHAGHQLRFWVANECVATLDTPIEADTLNLLESLQQQYDLRFLFIPLGDYGTSDNSAPDVFPGLGRVG